MAITVKHNKVSTIPDGDDSSLIRPSDWNDDHVLTGTVPIANGGTGETTANAALNALLPSQTGNSGKVLSTNGTDATWTTNGSGDVVGPASATDNAIARFDSTTGKLIQNSVVTIGDTGAIAGATTITNLNYLDFDTTYATTLSAGQLGWNGNDTLGLGMIGGNVVQHIGEDTFFYVKASSAITKGQLCMFTGAVGSSGVLTAAPSNSIPFAEAIIGVAAEDIALNGFGLIQNVGTLRGVDTSAFLDGDILYYDSAVTGGFTKTFPTSGPIVIAAAVAKSGSGGSGVLTVRISFQTRVTASTGISVSQGNDTVTVTNTAPDQVVSLTAGTNITVTGTYPSFTIAASGGGSMVYPSGTGIAVVTGGTSWGTTLTAPSGAIVGTTDTQTLSNKTLTGTKETVFAITDGAAFEIDPANGGIQTITLGANRTPKGTNFTAGQSVTLMVTASTYTLTWTDATFGASGVNWTGGFAPTLSSTGISVIELWEVGTQVYGALVGFN